MNSKSQKIALALVLSNIFITFVGIGLVIPVLPSLMNELSISGTVVGNMVAAFALAQLIASPITGKWTDKYGRKIMIIVGLFLFSFSEFLFGIGKTLEILFLSRILGGISGACIMPAITAFIADITSENERPKALGFMSAAINTGFIIGPGIGGFLAEFGIRVPFFAAGVLGAVVAIASIFLLKEPERREQPDIMKGQKVGWKRVFMPVYFISFIIIFLSTFSLSSFESLFSLFVDHKFGFTPRDIAIIVTGGGIVGAVAQILLFDKLTRRLGEIMVVRLSLILSALLVFVMTIVDSYWSVMLTCWIVFVGFDLIRPGITSYLSKIAGDEQGFVGGMNSMFTSIGNIFGPIIGGILFDMNFNFPFYFATIILVVSITIAIFWKKQTPSTE
ncbi:MAG: MFS transporter [Bacilli bacterium]|jgi:DHA1 family multidrug resistance protein-like MFS transporter|uniref:MFS transporter n=1 Tax=Ureibacillus sp. FSL W7-1570 TaxID=2954593 RepID=UPI001ECBA044|nr:MFS transporter [Bacilli bacterium]